MSCVGNERGNAQITTLSLLVLLGFGALSVDFGQLMLANSQTRVAVEAASLGGVMYLDGTAAGVAKAKQKAAVFAAMNNIIGQPAQLRAEDIEIGIMTGGTFSVVTDLNAVDVARINALRVREEAALSTSILAMAAFGNHEMTTDAGATAVRQSGPAASTECFLPLAVPDCFWDAAANPGANPPPIEFIFNKTGNDNVAWADPFSNPSSSTLREQLGAKCSRAELHVGDMIQVNEGHHSTGLTEMAAILNGTSATPSTSWPPSFLGPIPPRDGTAANLESLSAIDAGSWGNVIEGPVALVDAGIGCTDLGFKDQLEITGFVYAYIYDVADGSKNIWLQLDYIGEYVVSGDISENATGNVTAVTDGMLTL